MQECIVAKVADKFVDPICKPIEIYKFDKANRSYPHNSYLMGNISLNISEFCDLNHQS